MDTQSTNETSVTIARHNNGHLTRQDPEVLIQPPAGPLVRIQDTRYKIQEALFNVGLHVN